MLTASGGHIRIDVTVGRLSSGCCALLAHKSQSLNIKWLGVVGRRLVVAGV
jgi:hypothetical protein